MMMQLGGKKEIRLITFVLQEDKTLNSKLRKLNFLD